MGVAVAVDGTRKRVTIPGTKVDAHSPGREGGNPSGPLPVLPGCQVRMIPSGNNSRKAVPAASDSETLAEDEGGMIRSPRKVRTLWLVFLAGPVLLASCRAPGRRSLEAELVPCPLSETASTLLHRVIRDSASSDGRWAHDLGPGCPRIWATHLGLGAGLRREREDLIHLGEVTASRQRKDFDSLALESLFGGGVPEPGPETHGLPALLISGILAGSGSHYARFLLAFDRALETMDFARLPDTQRTGFCLLLCEVARSEPDRATDLLARARDLASTIEHPKFRAFARSRLAMASGSDEDLELARQVAREALPPLELRDGQLEVQLEEKYVLSRYLALTGALCDLALLDPGGGHRERALLLLDVIFSEAFLRDGVLVHDASRDGYRSESHCSGCNLQAIHLVDRLHGDTFQIAPLPSLPDRDSSWPGTPGRVISLFRVGPGQPGTYFGETFRVQVGYRESGEGELIVEVQLKDFDRGVTLERRGEKSARVERGADDTAILGLSAEDAVEGDPDPGLIRYRILLGPAVEGRRLIRLGISGSEAGS